MNQVRAKSGSESDPPSVSGYGWLAVALAIGQIAILVATQLVPLLARTWGIRTESAISRSARLAYGQDFADYIVFLRRSIPEDARVVIPWPKADPVFSEMPFMQYFLFPRRLTNCPAEPEWASCVANYAGPKTYLVAIGPFPPHSGLERLKVYLPFDDLRGVWAPATKSGE